MKNVTATCGESGQHIWIIDQQQRVVFETASAKIFQRRYQLSLSKLLAIALGDGCILHATKSACCNCPVEECVDPNGFPFILLTEDGKEKEFWGQVHLEQQHYMIQVHTKDHKPKNSHSMLDYLTNARENERKKIAQELHDGIAQSVYSLMLETRMIKWLPQDEVPLRLAAIDGHFAEVLQEIKTLASDMRPPALDQFGIVSAVKQLSTRMQEMTGFDVHLQVIGKEEVLPETIRIGLFRIIQEGINNAMKYSGENEVTIQLDFSLAYIQCLIMDRGVGFLPDQEKDGFGLLHMKERVLGFSGTLTIRSQPNKGTQIRIVIPCKEVSR